MLGNNTKHYVESVMKILKDKIVERVHRYNPIQLLDFMITKHSGILFTSTYGLSILRVNINIKASYLLRPFPYLGSRIKF